MRDVPKTNRSVTRRRLLHTLSASSAAALLAACGAPAASVFPTNAPPTSIPPTSVPPTAKPTNVPATSAPAAEAPTSAPTPATGGTAKRLVRDVRGEVQLPANPTRIVVIAPEPIGPSLLALGVMPLAAGSFDPLSPTPWPALVTPLYDPSVVPIDRFEPNLEIIARLKPDLILTDMLRVTDELLPKLRVIAPVFVTDYYGKGNPDDQGWEKLLTRVGDAVGKPAVAARVLQEKQALIAMARQQIAPLGIRATVANANEGHVYVWNDSYFYTRMLMVLGVTIDPHAQDLLAYRVDDYTLATTISFELMPRLLKTDWLVVPVEDDSSADEGWKQLSGNALWQTLPAVKAHHVVLVDNSLFQSGPYGIEPAVTALVTGLTKKP